MTITSEHSFPVWGTQGGGLVRQEGERYIFVEAPDPCMNLAVGDLMPEEWDVIPANKEARQVTDGFDWDFYDKAMEDEIHGQPTTF